MGIDIIVTCYSKRYVKESQLGAFCLLVIVYCYSEFKLCYLENLKLFSIGVKELLHFCEKSQQVFALFKSIFFRNRSLSNPR